MWRTGVNAQPYPIQGADGGFYYVDWPNIAVWMNDYSKAGWYNLTSLDDQGNYLWSYVVDNGTLSILATYNDGTILVHHYNSIYDNSTSSYVTLLDLDHRDIDQWDRIVAGRPSGPYLPGPAGEPERNFPDECL